MWYLRGERYRQEEEIRRAQGAVAAALSAATAEAKSAQDPRKAASNAKWAAKSLASALKEGFSTAGQQAQPRKSQFREAEHLAEQRHASAVSSLKQDLGIDTHSLAC